ncbi:glycosyltransferase family 2 protein [Aquirufa lenticrescens]|uniref:glycosyltransferase family 2 protein n=1 Tax=Aquirufa lenticrescens TaxID=2696560 RepID=UPI001CAA5EAC|nr:glycosyltransferase family 2 protein [Aquirufa lenticrescens]
MPLAGKSDLFVNSGYHYPKPLIEINGKTMIEWVVSNPSKIERLHQFIFIVKEEDVIKYHLDNTLRLICPGCEIIKIKNQTKGGLCSVLMAIDKVMPDDSLLILNSDQIVDIDFNEVDQFWLKEKVDAGLVTFNSVHPRWSYARIEEGLVVQTAEKNPISNQSIAGYYYFQNSELFFKAAFQTIKNDVQLEGMYYISPVINQYVLNNLKVKSFKIDNKKFNSFYSPQMMAEYERNIR